MTQFYTYLHCRPDGMPFYVGKGMGKRSHQFSRHRRNNYYTRIVAKYGKENISVFVFPCESEQQAFDDEIHQIAQLRREGYALCNQTNGGDGASGAKRSDETRLKMSLSQKGKKLSPEHIAKMSAARIGKKASSETRAKISASLKGKSKPLRSKEHCKKMSAAKKNPSAETRAKISASKKGQTSWNKGISPSEETRKKISTKVSISLIGNKRSLGKNLGNTWSIGNKNASGKRTLEQCARIAEGKEKAKLKRGQQS